MRNTLLTIAVLALAWAPAVARAVELPNPLGEESVPKLIGRVISAALSVVGSLALLMFVYGGFLWLTSRGDPKQVGKGKDTIMWATLGLAIIFGAYVLVNTIIDAVATGGVSGS